MMEIQNKRNKVKPRNITIYGLISFYGTERANKCATFLHKTLPKLYSKPIINLYYDYEWTEVVKALQEEYGSKYRRLLHLKHPVIIFFNDRYIGDHRAIIHYVIVEHRALPDLPFPNLFPDFTDLLPKDDLKTYVYLDLRVGDWEDYVVGKMVFELHADYVPETCKFFADLCKPFHDRAYGTNEEKFKYSYLGSTIHRISGTSFIQGGKIPGCSFHVKDENFNIRHSNRGVLSLCNEGGNNSTTEFCISLKENKWLDGQLIAFGQLIFGEPILAAIEEIPSYYERPLKDIIIVGCGVIPNYKERLDHGFISEIEKQKELINKEVEDLRRSRLEDVKIFEEKIKLFLETSEKEKSVEFIYLESPSDFRFDFLPPSVPDETLSEYLEEDLLEEYTPEEYKPEELTLELVMKKRRAKNVVNLTNMMSLFLDLIVDNMDYAERGEKLEPLDYIPRKDIRDAVDVREIPSKELVAERFHSGMYSMPETIRKLLVTTFQKLTPSQLKMIGQETRDLLTRAGVDESTVKITGSESIISGVVFALVNVLEMKEGKNKIHDALNEIYDDSIKLLQQMGPDVVRSMRMPKLVQENVEPKSDDTSET
ncbi:uncharacterized protein [Halyomorpha halys]|uniref:uncharacterized protein n=1 Tax=Halyomorpha halys TaxID=286706 RepID=UPI0006D4D852|nr:uncharacterized protein LOC106692621 [Halyomorpha halys]